MNQGIRRGTSCRFSLHPVLSESWDLTFPHIPAVPWGVIPWLSPSSCQAFTASPIPTKFGPTQRTCRSRSTRLLGFDAEAQRSHPSSGSFCRVECGKSARNHQWVVNIPRCSVFIGSTTLAQISRNCQRVDILEKHQLYQFDGPKSGLAPSQQTMETYQGMISCKDFESPWGNLSTLRPEAFGKKWLCWGGSPNPQQTGTPKFPNRADSLRSKGVWGVVCR